MIQQLKPVQPARSAQHSRSAQMPALRQVHQPLRIIPLGGFQEVGRNMTVFEYGQDVIIIDMGLQFPEEDMPGIDYIIPNVKYLEGKEKNIRGIIITHGHYDHIGAIPHLAPKLGNPPIFSTPLTLGIIKKRQEDYPNGCHLNLQTINKDSKIKLGAFNIEFFHVNHNIPDGIGVVINTPSGSIVYTGDFKFDHSPIGDEPADIGRIAEIGQKGVLALMSDSTDAETPGYSISEQTILESLDIIFERTEGRIIVATFSSLMSRIQQIITLAEKYNRKVALDGYSMKTNVEIARELGYIKVKKGTFINVSQINHYPPRGSVILCTGAQGEGSAVLMRIANHEHRFVKIQKNDTVIFSSSVVPGNERTVQGLKDTIYRQGAKVLHYKMMDVHAGGHAPQEDLKMMINLTKPQFFIPMHGSYYMLKLHAELAEKRGIPEKNIAVAENGQVIELTSKSIKATREKVPTNYVMVDGLGVGDVGNVVLRDRQMMAKDGMFTIIFAIDSKTGRMIGDVDIISRGFIYMKEATVLLDDVKKKVKEIVAKSTGTPTRPNWAYIRDNVRNSIGEFLYHKTQRRPMVLPVVIEV